MAVLLIGTLDTKGPEIAYVRDRLRGHGVDVIVADSGILGDPLDIVPDVTRAEVAVLAGTTIDALRNARQLASVVPADVDDVIVVSEESAISPRSVALGLDRMYPGIDDAAHRLHTRTDILWDKMI